MSVPRNLLWEPLPLPRAEVGRLFGKHQTENSLGLARPVNQLLNATVEVKSNHRYYVNKWVWLSSNKMLFTKSGGGPTGWSFPTPYLHHENQQTLKIRRFLFLQIVSC